jgi:hypothetical protein
MLMMLLSGFSEAWPLFDFDFLNSTFFFVSISVLKFFSMYISFIFISMLKKKNCVCLACRLGGAGVGVGTWPLGPDFKLRL